VQEAAWLSTVNGVVAEEAPTGRTRPVAMTVTKPGAGPEATKCICVPPGNSPTVLRIRHLVRPLSFSDQRVVQSPSLMETR
jgi:hypothetical protein